MKLPELPETIQYRHEPYYNATLGNLRWVNFEGRQIIEGEVIEGTETSRLFHATESRDITGKKLKMFGVKDWELERGLVVRCYC